MNLLNNNISIEKKMKNLLLQWNLICVCFLFLCGLSEISFTQPINSDSQFLVKSIQKIKESNTGWVTSGNNMIVYGIGKRVNIASEEYPHNVIKSIMLDSKVSGAVIYGHYCYLAVSGKGIIIIDLSNYNNLQIVNSIPLYGGKFYVAQSKELLYVVDQGSGLRIYELYDPENPMEIGFLSISDKVSGLSASNTLAYIAFSNKGITLVDVSMPEEPIITGHIDFDIPVVSLSSSETEIYISSGLYGFTILDLTEPIGSNSFFHQQIDSYGISIMGRAFYMAAREKGLFLVTSESRVPTTYIVYVGQGGSNFSPSNLIVAQGDTVEWVWISGTHTTTSGNNCIADGIWNSGNKSSGTFSYTFNNLGTYPYFCALHCAMGMTGIVTVNSVGPPSVLTCPACANIQQ